MQYGGENALKRICLINYKYTVGDSNHTPQGFFIRSVYKKETIDFLRPVISPFCNLSPTWGKGMGKVQSNENLAVNLLQL